MSYLVLARKYRPRDFESLVGQPHVVQALVNALTQQRLHHAYLFTGTRGVGKTTIARILAKSLDCTGLDGKGGITAHPCGVCDSCRDIDAGRYIDYVELDAASNRGVEEITRLLDQAVYKPVVARFKVYLIDEVHMLSNHAFNAMLKTLEEPPDYLKFILATTDPQKVPPTVLSRCLQFNLRPMAGATIHEHLSEVLGHEQLEAEPGALRLLARAARGSMRDALSLTDQAIAFGSGDITETGVRTMLGAVDRGHAVRIVEALAAADGAALVVAVDALRSLGLAAGALLEELALLLQQMALAQAVPDAADPADPDAAAVRALAPLLAPDETQVFYSIALQGRSELGLAPDEYSGLVMVLLRMLAFAPEGATAKPKQERGAVTSAALARTVEGSVAKSSIARVAVPSKVASVQPERAPPVAAQPGALEARVAFRGEPAPVSAPQSLDPSADAAAGDEWDRVVREMLARGSIAALARELAMQAQCTSIESDAEGPIWRLRVEREMLRSPAQVERLQSALGDVLGQVVRLRVEAGVAIGSPSQRDAAERARRQAHAERVIHDDPLVQALLTQYKGARIVPGSVKPI